MSYKIGSFNVRDLSYSAGASRDLDMIADIIKECDIIALQEVLSEGKILEGATMNNASGQAKAYEYSLRMRLGDNWDMCWLDPQTSSQWYPYLGEDTRGEGYAFLWRKDKFRCPVTMQGKEIRPRIIHQYKTDSSLGEMKLIRDPGYGRFQFVSLPNAELRLLTTHIVYGKPSEGNLSKTLDFGATVMRQNEFNVLARNIYTSVCDDHNDSNCTVPYTIILGDYNLNLIESGLSSPLVPSVMVIDQNKKILNTNGAKEEKGFYIMHTEQTDLTTVNQSADDYANNYDHFTYEENVRARVIQGIPRRINMIEKIGDYKTYKEKISDHLPIILEFDFK